MEEILKHNQKLLHKLSTNKTEIKKFFKKVLEQTPLI
jgi:hypothetical protein